MIDWLSMRCRSCVLRCHTNGILPIEFIQKKCLIKKRTWVRKPYETGIGPACVAYGKPESPPFNF